MKRSVLPILVVLGLVWAAFASASASAKSTTVLCKANEQPCSAANVYAEGTTIVAEAKEASDQVKIAAYSFTATCPSKLEATVGGHSGEDQLLSVSSWTLGNASEGCTAFSPNDCGTANDKNVPYSAQAAWPTQGIVFEGPTWHLRCTAGKYTFLDCTYGEVGMPSFSSDHKALQYSKVGLGSLEGPTCSNAELTATFKIVKPEAPMYVSWIEPPGSTTNKPSHVKATSAILNGTVNPKSIATNYWFEYGTSTSYGSKTSTYSAGSGSADINVAKEISGLAAGTTYHYRLVAKNSSGLESKGEDMTIGPPVFRSSFGGSGYGEDQFISPAGVAVDSGGNVWAIDREEARIEKWSASGEFLSAFGEEGEEEGQLSTPTALAIDSEGNLWVSDTGNSRIEEFSHDGEFLFAIGQEDLFRPEGIAIDPEGNIWVADRQEHAVYEFDPEGNLMRWLSGPLKSPTGLAIASGESGSFRIYVSDRVNNRIYTYYSAPWFEGGNPVLGSEWGSSGSGNGQFNHPTALAADLEGNIWAIDEGNARVEEFTSTGAYVTQFESKGYFEAPGGIATDAKGNIWVADQGQYRVDQWSR